LSDNAAIEEANRILKNPPKIIVNLNLPRQVFDEHERLFRSGNVSGQRYIYESIINLTTNNYNLINRMNCVGCYSLDIWELK